MIESLTQYLSTLAGGKRTRKAGKKLRHKLQKEMHN